MVNEELKPRSHAKKHNGVPKDASEMYWKKDQKRRGLGNLLSTVNHIAITVSDVEKSLWFYSEVLGLPQIKRPNFDRQGAWLSMGNIEFHLLFGQPQVPSSGSLIVSHISVETKNIKEVLTRLEEMEIPFETNVSVSKEGVDEDKGIITQFFLRDPDGYYIELFYFETLTDFCLGNGKVYLEGYEESSIKNINLSILSKLVVLSEQAKKGNEDHKKIAKETLADFDESDSGAQSETEEFLKIILQKTNNNVLDAIKYIKAKHGDQQILQPPAIYNNNKEDKVPELVSLSH